MEQANSVFAAIDPKAHPDTPHYVAAHPQSADVKRRSGIPVDPDPFDARCVLIAGKRLYLGGDTRVRRLFDLLANPVGASHHIEEVQREIDGYETSERIGSSPEDIKKAAARVRQTASRLRKRMRQHRVEDHYVLHRGGRQHAPEYSLLPRYSPSN